MDQIVTTPEQLAELVDAYSRFEEFAVDTETRAGREKRHDDDQPELDCLTNEVFWISFAGPGRSDAIPIGHPLGRLLKPAVSIKLPQPDCPDRRRCQRCRHGWKYNKDGSVSRAQFTHKVDAKFAPPPEQLTHEQVWPVLKPLLLGDARKVGHNIKFDAKSLAKYLGEPMAGPLVDTMIAAWLVNENHGQGQYKLGACVERELHWSYDKSLGKAGVQNFSFEDAGRYARLDSFADWLLWRKLRAQLVKEKQESIFFDIEQPVLDVVIAMEMAGAPIDVEAMERLEESLRGRLAEVQADIEEYNGGPINLNADAQVRELVYGKRGRKVTQWTAKTELPSTSAKALGHHAFRDPNAEEDVKWDPANIKDKCVAAILEHAATHKVYSTYIVNNLPAARATGKLFAEFDQIGTVTGRFSSRNPNLQNIPIRKGKEIRDLFIAGDGYKLIVSDYSQVELRILAHYTQDPLLLKAYFEGFDLHSATARRAYGIPADKEPTTMERSLAKNTNFSMVYGATAWTLVQRYNVPEDVAESLVEAFYSTYKKVAPWQRSVLKECRSRARTKKRHGYHVDPYVTTLLGRKRRLPEIMFPDSGAQIPGKDEGVTYGKRRRAAERQAINTVIQGTAADIMKLAMIEIHRRKVEEGLPVDLLMVVHDEAVLRVPEAEADAMLEEVNGAMEGVNMLSVPLVAEGKICDRWSEAK